MNKLDINRIKENTKLNDVIHYESIDSTNIQAKELGKTGLNDVLLVADYQSHGRGRLNKSFYSPKDGLYFSLLFKPQCTVEESQFITILAGVIFSETLEELYNVKIDIKWLNDLYINKKKVCGILAEGVLSTSSSYDYMILGIGLNLKKPDYLPDEIKDIYTSLDEVTDEILIREDILNLFIRKFYQALEDLNDIHDDIINKYKSRCFMINKSITIKQTHRKYLVKDIDFWGHLIVEDEDGNLSSLNSGELSINYEN